MNLAARDGFRPPRLADEASSVLTGGSTQKSPTWPVKSGRPHVLRPFERLRGDRHPSEGSSPTMAASNIPVEPPILYWGTPVVLNSTENPNGSFNLAPISSAFWLGWRCMLGIEATSQTAQNLMRTGQIVVNLVDHNQVDVVNKLSMLTGSDPVPTGTALRGYLFEEGK